MVEITDTPLRSKSHLRRQRKVWIFLGLAALVLSCLAWGMESIHVGNVSGMDFQVEYSGYKGLGPEGEYIYSKGSQVAYHIFIKNRSNESFGRVEVQSSLHSDGATCPGSYLAAEAHLPGAAFSAPQT